MTRAESIATEVVPIGKIIKIKKVLRIASAGPVSMRYQVRKREQAVSGAEVLGKFR